MPGYGAQGTASANRPAGLAMPAGYRASGGAGQDENPNNFKVGASQSGLRMPGGSSDEDVEGSENSGASYTVKKGDSLWSIAKKVYGNGKYWRLILAANPKALAKSGQVRTLKIGAVLTVPPLDKTLNKK